MSEPIWSEGHVPFDPASIDDMAPAPEPPLLENVEQGFLDPITDQELVDVIQQHLILGEPMSTTPSQSSLHRTTTHGSTNNELADIEAVATPFHLPGSAITNDIYKMANDLVQRSNMIRSKSSTDLLEHRRQELHSDPALQNINKPGGFRRFFVHQQDRDTPSVSEDGSSLHRYNSVILSEHDGDTTASPVAYKRTRHFLEFLAVSHIGIFDNFAGEDLSDTDDDDEVEDDVEARIPLHRDRPVAGSTERTPLLRRKSSHMADRGTATETKALFLLLKAFIGSGVLFLPRAFSNGGLLFSFTSMWLMGAISLFSFLLLIDCKKYVSGSYGDVGGALYGEWMRKLVLFSVAISQIGFVAAGTTFIAENVQQVVATVSNNSVHLSVEFIISMAAILMVPLCLIRNIAKLSLSAVISDLLILCGLLALLYFDIFNLFFKHDTPEKSAIINPGPGIHWFFNSAHFSVFVGTCVYSFEGVGLIIPIRDAMAQKERFPAVLTLVMVIVSFILSIIGGMGYLAYGSNVRTVALLNLPDGPLISTIQSLYVIAILLSNVVTIFPSIRIVEQAVFQTKTGKYNMAIKWEKNSLRVMVVCFTCLIAYGGASDLDKFVSLIGSVCCCPLSLIFPPMFHLRAVPGLPKWRYMIDYVMICFGAFVMLFTMYNTASQWAHGA